MLQTGCREKHEKDTRTNKRKAAVKSADSKKGLTAAGRKIRRVSYFRTKIDDEFMLQIYSNFRKTTI